MNENHKQVLAFLQSQETKLNYIYTDLSRKLASLLKRYNINSSSNVWHRNLGLQKEVDALFKEFQPQLLQHFSDEITKAWGMADTQNDNFVRAYLGKTVISDAERAVMFGRNAKALEAFLTKRQRNFTLSERVWDLTKQTKSQIEYFLKEGLTDGRSATKLAGDLQSFLKEPERRFRRIKDKKTGKLKISEPGKDYHPGRGVYRSSYKNALRLARNEVNIAYRTADNIRREKLDFVVGTEVHLSNAHPTYDICDELVGKYPKGFNFTGWHVNCLCYSTSVLLPISDFKKYQKGDLNPNTKAVKTIPKRASKYIDNMPKEKVSKLQFVDENKKYFKKSERKSKLKKNVEVKKEVDVQTFIPAKSMEEVKDRFKNIGFKRVEINGTTLEQANIYLNGIESEFVGLNKKPEINMLEIFRNKNEKYQGEYSFTSNIMRFNTEHAFYGRDLGDVVGFEERIKVLEKARKGRLKSIEFYEGQKNKKRWRSDINSNKDMLWKIDYEIKSLKDKIKKGEVEKVFTYYDSFDSKTDKIKALVHHEFGHYWDNVFSNKNRIRQNDLLAVSEYAKSNTEEYIAEMYSKYRMTNSLEGMPDDLVDFFNKINR